MAILGTIGAGSWGANWVRTLAGMAGHELRWCCDVNPAALEKIRRQHPQIGITTRVDDLLEDAKLQGVVVASSVPTHFALAARLLRAGKHVLVEKPLTLTTAEARALTELARQRQRVLMVGHLLEYHPAILHIRQLIDSGELGEVQYVYSQRLNLGTVRGEENAWWSLAPHDIAVACRLLGGRPLSVQCRGQSVLQPRIADVVFAVLEFPHGRLAHMHVGWLDPRKERNLTVVGARKMAVFDDTLPEGKLVIHDKSVVVRGGTQPMPRNGGMVVPRLDTTEPLLCEARHFVECLTQRKQPLSDGDAGAMVVSVLEHGQRSLERAGEVVFLPEEATAWPRAA